MLSLTSQCNQTLTIPVFDNHSNCRKVRRVGSVDMYILKMSDVHTLATPFLVPVLYCEYYIIVVIYL